MNYEKMWYMLKSMLLKEDQYLAGRDVLTKMDRIEIEEHINMEDEEQ